MSSQPFRPSYPTSTTTAQQQGTAESSTSLPAAAGCALQETPHRISGREGRTQQRLHQHNNVLASLLQSSNTNSCMENESADGIISSSTTISQYPCRNTRMEGSQSHLLLACFTWGRGEDGQLGLGDTADQDEPTYVCLYLYFGRVEDGFGLA